jgi:hypothetical protein
MQNQLLTRRITHPPGWMSLPVPRNSTNRKPKAPPKQAKWSVADDATHILVLTDQQADGNQVDNAWKGCVWQVASQELAGSKAMSGQAIKTPSKCHTCWDKVSNPLAATCCWLCTDIMTKFKAEFVIIKHLYELSGWS